MRSRWTFSRKLALGFAVIATPFATVAITGLRTTPSLARTARALRQIAVQIATALEATREIEPSTPQPASAVEQAHVAIAGLAQTTRETEAGAAYTLQTSSQSTSPTSLTRWVQAT